MSINKNEKESEAAFELGLDLGFSNRCMQRRFMRQYGLGAGANAGSALNMTFVTNNNNINNNHLSELVWSSLKGPSNVALLPAHRISTTENKGIGGDVFSVYSNTKNLNEEEIGDQMDRVTREDQVSKSSGRSNKKMTDASSKKTDPKEIRIEALSESNDQAVKMDFVPTEKRDSVSENDSHNSKSKCKVSTALVISPHHKAKETVVVREKGSPADLNRMKGKGKGKGKEKALSDGDAKMVSKDEVESHESVESCNSAGHFATATSSGKRRRSFEEGLICGTKGIKRQTSTVAKQESSFMNWISNVMKGFSQQMGQESDNPVPLSVAGPIDNGTENPDRRIVSFEKAQDQPPGTTKIIGFQSVFQSLYCLKAEVRETRVLNVECQIESGDRISDDKEKGKIVEKVVSEPSSEKERDTNSNKSKKSDIDINPRDNISNSPSNPLCRSRKDNIGSSWITRFSAKIPGSSSNSIAPIPTMRPPSMMIASRSDAHKHVTSLRVTSDKVVCLFCGAKGHKLRDCSEISKTELGDLLHNHNHNNLDEIVSDSGEAIRLCLKCFQKNHWAIACPNKGSPTKRFRVELPFKEMQITSGDNNDKENSKLKINKEGDLEALSGLVVPLKENNLVFRTSVDHKQVASVFVDDASRENQIAPFSFFVADQRNVVVPKGIFDLVRTLRLSRSDVIKWINSRASVSQIEGFFLRLRLGKWEEGLGGTGYHVACVIGTQRDKKQKGSKSSLLVNVGGMKCLVESRYISNNDFLEEELMAWWSICIRNGDKIPSEEDLRIKVKNKRISDLF